MARNSIIVDKNPSSGAYGIAQVITGPRWYSQHGDNASTIQEQLIAMANYIEGRYHNPSAAKNNW